MPVARDRCFSVRSVTLRLSISFSLALTVLFSASSSRACGRNFQSVHTNVSRLMEDGVMGWTAPLHRHSYVMMRP